MPYPPTSVKWRGLPFEHWVGVALGEPAIHSGPWGRWGQRRGVLAGIGRGEEGTGKGGRSAQVARYIYKCTQYQPWMTSTGLVEQSELEDTSCNNCNKWNMSPKQEVCIETGSFSLLFYWKKNVLSLTQAGFCTMFRFPSNTLYSYRF